MQVATAGINILMLSFEIVTRQPLRLFLHFLFFPYMSASERSKRWQTVSATSFKPDKQFRRGVSGLVAKGEVLLHCSVTIVMKIKVLHA